jgi:hypothetical protein
MLNSDGFFRDKVPKKEDVCIITPINYIKP